MKVNNEEFKQQSNKFVEDLSKITEGCDDIIPAVQKDIQNQFVNLNELSNTPEAAMGKAEVNNQITGKVAGTVIENVSKEDLPKVKNAVVMAALKAYIENCILKQSKGE